MRRRFLNLITVVALVVLGSFVVLPEFANAQTCYKLTGALHVCTPIAAPNERPDYCTPAQSDTMNCAGPVPAGYTLTSGLVPPTGTITATPEKVDPDKRATLTWSTKNAVSCTINGTKNPTKGTIQTPKLTTSSNFKLVCKNGDGTAFPIDAAYVVVNKPTNPEQPGTQNPDTYDPPTPPPPPIDLNIKYYPLEPLVNVDQSGTSGIAQFITGFFKIIVNLAAFLAVVVLVVGGITYMVSESTVTKLVGRERVKAAFIGLLIIGASWLILNTINPNLLKFDESKLQPQAPYSPPTDGGGGGGGNGGGGTTLGKDGVERKNVGSTKLMDKIREEFKCPKTSDDPNCVWNKMLVFDNSKATNAQVISAIEKYEDDCHGDWGQFTRFRVKERPGTFVNAGQNTTVHMCVGRGFLGPQ